MIRFQKCQESLPNLSVLKMLYSTSFAQSSLEAGLDLYVLHQRSVFDCLHYIRDVVYYIVCYICKCIRHKLSKDSLNDEAAVLRASPELIW